MEPAAKNAPETNREVIAEFSQASQTLNASHEDQMTLVLDEYRSVVQTSGIGQLATAVDQPLHIPFLGKTLPTSPLSGEDFIRLACAYRQSRPNDSPSIYGYSEGKRHLRLEELLETFPIWSSDPTEGCHKVLSMLGGATIRLTDVHLMSRTAYAMRNAILDATSSTGETHAFYSTPRCGTAVPYHRDSGIQVIYQVTGEKRWFFDGGTDKTLLLRPGDFLIIPLARLHRAETEALYSIHLTVMLNPIAELAIMEVLTRGFLGLEV